MHETIIRYIKVGGSVILGLASAGVILYKIAISNLSFSASSLDTTDVLSIVLAIFSVALSVMFYFKGSEESSKFYNNSYQFTKEISELLGRIEAGFGEKLRHIDDGYSSIGKRLDDVLALRAKAAERLKEEEEEVESASVDRDKIISTLLEKANVSEEEKQRIRAELEEKEKELAYARMQVMQYRTQIQELERTTASEVPLDPELDRYLRITSDIIGIRHMSRAPISWLTKRIKDQLPHLPSDYVDFMSRRNLMQADCTLTSEGLLAFRRWGSVHE